MYKSQSANDKPSLIGAWSGHVPMKNFEGFSHISGTAENEILVENRWF